MERRFADTKHNQTRLKRLNRVKIQLYCVLVCLHSSQLKALLVAGKNGDWTLPFGKIQTNRDQDLTGSAQRILKNSGYQAAYIEQLCSLGSCSFGSSTIDKDNKYWNLSIAYVALTPFPYSKFSAKEHQWVTLEQLSSSSIENEGGINDGLKNVTVKQHEINIIKLSCERLKQKAQYSLVPGFALPKEFTLSELQQVHELMINKQLDKKSFRRRIQKANMLLDTGKKRRRAGRPAHLYSLLPNAANYTFVRTLLA